MRRSCCICQTPLDGGGEVADPSNVSHGFCTSCATNERVKIDEIPRCGLVGKWGVCNLFDGHVGACRELDD